MTSTQKTTRSSDISLRKVAIIAGVGLLIMTITAVFANFAVLESLIVQGDAIATTNNIIASEGQFRLGIVSFLIVLILDVVVAWALYIFLQPVDKNLSLLTAWFRLIYTAIFGVSLLNLVNVLQLLGGADFLKAIETNQLHAQVMLSIRAFNDGWDIGFVFFGLHLTLLGYLVFKSGYIPKFLGILLVIAGLGYLIDSFGTFLSPNYSVEIAIFTFIGELLLMFWLLLKGRRVQQLL